MCFSFKKIWQNLWRQRLAHSQEERVFSFQESDSKILGTMYTPIVKVKLWSKLYNDWLEVEMVVDTGADYTVLPNFLGEQLGLELETECRLLKMQGVGGVQKIYYFDDLKVKLGKYDRQIPVGFVESDMVPPLMGRHQFFETFKISFFENDRIDFKEL